LPTYIDGGTSYLRKEVASELGT